MDRRVRRSASEALSAYRELDSGKSRSRGTELGLEIVMQTKHTDPYREAAAKMFQVPYAQVTDEQRRKAKNVLYQNFYTPGKPLLSLRARGK